MFILPLLLVGWFFARGFGALMWYWLTVAALCGLAALATGAGWLFGVGALFCMWRAGVWNDEIVLYPEGEWEENSKRIMAHLLGVVVLGCVGALLQYLEYVPSWWLFALYGVGAYFVSYSVLYWLVFNTDIEHGDWALTGLASMFTMILLFAGTYSFHFNSTLFVRLVVFCVLYGIIQLSRKYGLGYLLGKSWGIVKHKAKGLFK
jgi:hypothetical protein